MKWKLNLPNRAMLVYYYVKFTGLAPFTVKNNGFHPPSFLYRLYAVFLAFVSISFAPMTFASLLEVDHSLLMRSSPLLKIANDIHNVIELLMAFLTIAIFSLMYKKILKIVNKLWTIGRKFMELGVKEDSGKFFKNLFLTIVVGNAVLITTCVVSNFMEPNWSLGFKIKYALDSWFQMNVVLIFTQTLYFIRRWFELINESLHRVFRPAGNLRCLRNSRVPVLSGNLRKEDGPELEDLTCLQRIQKIEALHLELCDLVNRTSQTLAVPILLKSIQSLFELLVYCFWVLDTIQHLPQLNAAREIAPSVMSISCSLMRMVIVIGLLVAIVHASVSTCAEGNATTAVLFKLWNKFSPLELKNEFVMFALQLQHQPVAVSPCAFASLDYSYLYQTACALLTYLVIMIQFNTPQRNLGA